MTNVIIGIVIVLLLSMVYVSLILLFLSIVYASLTLPPT